MSPTMGLAKALAAVAVAVGSVQASPAPQIPVSQLDDGQIVAISTLPSSVPDFGGSPPSSATSVPTAAIVSVSEPTTTMANLVTLTQPDGSEVTSEDPADPATTIQPGADHLTTSISTGQDPATSEIDVGGATVTIPCETSSAFNPFASVASVIQSILSTSTPVSRSTTTNIGGLTTVTVATTLTLPCESTTLPSGEPVESPCLTVTTLPIITSTEGLGSVSSGLSNLPGDVTSNLNDPTTSIAATEVPGGLSSALTSLLGEATSSANDPLTATGIAPTHVPSSLSTPLTSLLGEVTSSLDDPLSIISTTSIPGATDLSSIVGDLTSDLDSQLTAEPTLTDLTSIVGGITSDLNSQLTMIPTPTDPSGLLTSILGNVGSDLATALPSATGLTSILGVISSDLESQLSALPTATDLTSIVAGITSDLASQASAIPSLTDPAGVLTSILGDLTTVPSDPTAFLTSVLGDIGSQMTAVPTPAIPSSLLTSLLGNLGSSLSTQLIAAPTPTVPTSLLSSILGEISTDLESQFSNLPTGVPTDPTGVLTSILADASSDLESQLTAVPTASVPTGLLTSILGDISTNLESQLSNLPTGAPTDPTGIFTSILGDVSSDLESQLTAVSTASIPSGLLTSILGDISTDLESQLTVITTTLPTGAPTDANSVLTSILGDISSAIESQLTAVPGASDPAALTIPISTAELPVPTEVDPGLVSSKISSIISDVLGDATAVLTGGPLPTPTDVNPDLISSILSQAFQAISSLTTPVSNLPEPTLDPGMISSMLSSLLPTSDLNVPSETLPENSFTPVPTSVLNSIISDLLTASGSEATPIPLPTTETASLDTPTSIDAASVVSQMLTSLAAIPSGQDLPGVISSLVGAATDQLPMPTQDSASEDLSSLVESIVSNDLNLPSSSLPVTAPGIIPTLTSLVQSVGSNLLSSTAAIPGIGVNPPAQTSSPQSTGSATVSTAAPAITIPPDSCVDIPLVDAGINNDQITVEQNLITSEGTTYASLVGVGLQRVTVGSNGQPSVVAQNLPFGSGLSANAGYAITSCDPVMVLPIPVPGVTTVSWTLPFQNGITSQEAAINSEASSISSVDPNVPVDPSISIEQIIPSIASDPMVIITPAAPSLTITLPSVTAIPSVLVTPAPVLTPAPSATLPAGQCADLPGFGSNVNIMPTPVVTGDTVHAVASDVGLFPLATNSAGQASLIPFGSTSVPAISVPLSSPIGFSSVGFIPITPCGMAISVPSVDAPSITNIPIPIVTPLIPGAPVGTQAAAGLSPMIITSVIPHIQTTKGPLGLPVKTTSYETLILTMPVGIAVRDMPVATTAAADVKQGAKARKSVSTRW